MKLVSIFADRLFAFHYEEDELDTFGKVFDEWNDIEYLFNFFEANSVDFKPGYHGKDIDSTVFTTQQRAMKFQRALVAEAKASTTSPTRSLDNIFKPLHVPGVRRNKTFEENKAYGTGDPSILRIYALKIEDGIYAITGGAIKLTSDLKRKHLQQELHKLKRCQDFLKSEGVNDIDGFNELTY